MDIYTFQVSGEMLAIAVGALFAVSAGTLTGLIALDVTRGRRSPQGRRERQQPLLRSGAAQTA